MYASEGDPASELLASGVNWLARHVNAVMTSPWWPRPCSAVHRTIVVVDVAGFGDPQRTNRLQLRIRDGMYRVLRRALARAGIVWEVCRKEDRGDGVFLLAPPGIAKARFCVDLPRTLVEELQAHNRGRRPEEQIRMRLALHAGEVNYDGHGVTSAAVNLAFRLADAPALKAALAGSRAVLAMIASDYFFTDVIRHHPASHPETYRPETVTVKETTVPAWIRLPGAAKPVPLQQNLSVPRQLPSIPPFFAGRRTALAQLSTMGISAISGMGGIGKTWLALRWAKDRLDEFPDGQLYVNLRGFDPSGAPTPVHTAVRGLLDGLGVTSIPVDLDAMTALYRSMVSTKRMLILLDNAVDSSQVIPLLPGSSTCTVLVTSRHRLTGLVVGYGARPVELDVLDDEEAYELLAGHIGSRRMADEPIAVAQLMYQCAGLPLALGIVAARATMHPEFRLESLAQELEDSRLDVLNGGELSANLRSVMSWSYQALPEQAARVFGALGHIPGPSITLPAAAALTDLPEPVAREVLQDLSNAHLVQQYAPGRYRMHDLVRLYAAEQGTCLDAVRNLVSYYVHAAHVGERVLFPHRYPITICGPSYAVPQFATDTDAMAWFDAELPCLLAAQATASQHRWDPLVWELAWVLHGYLWRRGRIHEQLTTWRAALAAAQRLDLPAQALAHRLLGQTAIRAGLTAEAKEHLRWALVLTREIGDRVGEARTHYDLSWLTSDSEIALDHASRSLKLFSPMGNPVWEAEALNRIGWHRAMLGDLANARPACEQALALFTENDNRQGRASALTSLGLIAHRSGTPAEAMRFYRDALVLCQQLGARYEEAETLEHLGRLHCALGHKAEAERTWRQALGLYVEQCRTMAAEGLRQQLACVAA
ncbi:NB-ARC domain-containing protein [Actinocrispum sp. NPDC049592]|uniref:ATP-binding protein n=1 Tax=Actinocrispum sp. NPDC049592 TaxID=3154835 RepID=UPI0034148801